MAYRDDDFDDLPDDDVDLERLEAIELAHALGLAPPDEYDDGDEPVTLASMEAARAAAREKIFDPVPYKRKDERESKGIIIAVVDSETDPFAYGVSIAPFAIGFDDGNVYVDFIGTDCVDQFFNYLIARVKGGERFIVYAHNGGKFDFFFFLKFLDPNQTPFIMAGRLIKLLFAGVEFRDSFSIIPQALAGYKKDEIDYAKFDAKVRHKHMPEIREYLKSDCQYLRELIVGFWDMFGDKLTIASASLPTLHSFHGFERLRGDAVDERFRKYYYGGRNQCFETGVLTPRPGKRFKMIDRNSMYPAEMKDSLHPVSARAKLSRDIGPDTDFACIEADNFGALPMRADDGGLDFTVKSGTFWATGHEIRAGLDTGTLRIRRVKHAWTFDRRISFGEFVDTFYSKRLAAKADGDKVRDILYKFALNSGYGKFALNPSKFKQYIMTVDEIPEPLWSKDCPEGWRFESQSGEIRIWSRPNPRRGGYYNVATAASITGAARANLLRAIANSDRPLYCDTDSILCEDYKGELNETELGGWKLEATGAFAAIAGKKLYALFDVVDGVRGAYDKAGVFVPDEAIKKASKGVRLTATDIVRVAEGETVEYPNPVPLFGLDGSQEFQTRKIVATHR